MLSNLCVGLGQQLPEMNLSIAKNDFKASSKIVPLLSCFVLSRLTSTRSAVRISTCVMVCFHFLEGKVRRMRNLALRDWKLLGSVPKLTAQALQALGSSTRLRTMTWKRVAETTILEERTISTGHMVVKDFVGPNSWGTWGASGDPDHC